MRVDIAQYNLQMPVLTQMRRKSGAGKMRQCLISPSLVLDSPLTLELVLLAYESVHVACREKDYVNLISALSTAYSVKKSALNKRILHLDGKENPFDGGEKLRAVLGGALVSESVGFRIDMISVGCLGSSEEVRRDVGQRRLKKMYDKGIGIPAVALSALWVPMALRTRYILGRSVELNAAYASSDYYEAKVHSDLAEIGVLDTLPSMMDQTYLTMRLDQRTAILKEVVSFIPRSSRNPKKAGDILTKRCFRDVRDDLGQWLETIVDRLYSDPFYILGSEIKSLVDNGIAEMLASVEWKSGKSAAIGGAGLIPMPLGIPNPASLWGYWRDLASKRKLRKELGWLLYLVNLPQARASFYSIQSTILPKLRIVRFRDDVLYTLLPAYVQNRHTGIWHQASCHQLRKAQSANMVVCIGIDEDDFLVMERRCRQCFR